MNIYSQTKGLGLIKATHTNQKIKGSKALLCCFTLLIASGCVSQQSALDLNQTSPTQPVPVGIQLAGADINQNIGTSGSQTQITANNIPVRAPRPVANISSAPTTSVPLQQVAAVAANPAVTSIAPSVTAQVQQQVIEQVQTSTTQIITPTAPATLITPPATQIDAPTTAAATPTAGTLAIAETQAQSPTANVIAQATSPTSVTNKAIPVKKPAVAIAQQPTSVEVASLSPTLEAAPSIEATTPQRVKKKSFFEQVFTPKEKKPRPVANVTKPKVQRSSRAASRIETASRVSKPSVAKPKKSAVKKPVQIVARTRGTDNNTQGALPGVKSNSEIFGIKDAGPLKTKKTEKTTQVASVGSFGRLSPNGLRLQHSKVQVACLKPGVLRILKQVERRYGKRPIVTSGYRSPKGNRRAGGARNSQHIFCKAVDIQIEGVSKWKLAKYIRTLPGRGGVGTYCRTKSVHFDIGSKRDWHHPCRKSSKRKRKKT